MYYPISDRLYKYAVDLKGPIPKRVLGKTGLQVTQLGLGGESILSIKERETDAINYIRRALELGVNYFDTAPSYEPSEKRLGEGLYGSRKNVILASKTDERKRDGALKQLENSLKNLKTDHLDIWQLHHIDHIDEVEAIFGKNGALGALQEAREQGIVRYLGLSGHYDPDPILEAIRRFDFDTVLMVVNAADIHQHSFIKKVLPVAEKKEIGVIGMKACCRGRIFDPKYLNSMRDALYYTWSKPVATTIVGHDNVKQLMENVRYAKEFEELPDNKMKELESATETYAHLALFFRKGNEKYNPFWKSYEPKK